MPLSGSASAKAGLELSESELSDARVGHLDEKALRIAMQNFQQIDRNNDGKLDLEEFRSGMGMLGVDKTFSTIVFNSFDTGGDGALSLEQIRGAVRELWRGQYEHEPALMRAYEAADKDRSGAIGRREFHLLLSNIRHFDELWRLFGSIDKGAAHVAAPQRSHAGCASSRASGSSRGRRQSERKSTQPCRDAHDGIERRQARAGGMTCPEWRAGGVTRKPTPLCCCGIWRSHSRVESWRGDRTARA